jgi:hypothetical protein
VSCSRVPTKVKAQAEAREIERTRPAGITLSRDSRKEAAGKGVDTLGSIAMTGAICSCARTICGAILCPAAGMGLPENIPSSKMNGLYTTGRLFSLIPLSSMKRRNGLGPERN